MKTHLVSEEFLRQVLKALDHCFDFDASKEASDELRTLLAKEPSDPYAWAICWDDDEGHYAWRFSKPEEMNGKFSFPLFRKDTP